MSKLSIKALVIKIIALSLCIGGFAYDVYGMQNLHILYCIFVMTVTFSSIIIISLPEVAAKVFQDHPEYIRDGFKTKNPDHITSQIFMLIQILICAFFGAWVRVVLLILSSIFIFLVNAKTHGLYDAYIEAEKIKERSKEFDTQNSEKFKPSFTQQTMN